MIYYASLVKGLHGLYYPIAADSEAEARLKINNSSLKNLWCSVYTNIETERLVTEYGGVILPDAYLKKLDYDTFAVEQGMGLISK